MVKQKWSLEREDEVPEESSVVGCSGFSVGESPPGKSEKREEYSKRREESQ